MEDTLLGGDAADTENTSTETSTDTLIGGEDKAQDDSKDAPQTEGRGEEGKEEPSTDWTLEVPAGVNADMVSRTEQVCKAKGWSKEQAVDLVKIQQQEIESFNATRKGWRDEIKADTEFGGEHMDATIANANRALKVLDPSGEVAQMLRTTGYGDNAAVIRMLARAGAAYSEDKIIPGHGGDSRPLADRLYGHH